MAAGFRYGGELLKEWSRLVFTGKRRMTGSQKK
jgi:hypothetical protein